jgi:hypothetical protein
MEAGMIIGLAIGIPVILFPAAFVWYLNIGGVAAALREAREKRAAQEKGVETT